MLNEIKGDADETTLTFTTTFNPDAFDYDKLFNTPFVAYPSQGFVKILNNDELPERYIINKNATILFWKDGEKTIIKRSKNDKFDKRLAFLTAYFQKHCGMSKNKANKYLDELIVEEK